jgi:hypothetical protein
MALELSQPLAEISTKDLPGGKNRPASKADHLTAIYEPIVSQPYVPPRPVTGIALPFFKT